MAHAIVTICMLDVEESKLQECIVSAMLPYNMEHDPNNKWDSWVIFGGDADWGLAVRPGHDDDPRLVRNLCYGNGEPRQRWPLRCDGGPKSLLDFDTDRDKEAGLAEADWAEWNAFASDYPAAKPMRYFLNRHSVSPIQYPMVRAWNEYVDQPLIRVVRKQSGLEAVRLWNEFQDPVTRFGTEQSEYVRRRVARVVPTPALIQTDGEWVDDESFGDQFDASRWDRYFDVADRYLDALESDAMVVRVRFHS